MDDVSVFHDIDNYEDIPTYKDFLKVGIHNFRILLGYNAENIKSEKESILEKARILSKKRICISYNLNISGLGNNSDRNKADAFQIDNYSNNFKDVIGIHDYHHNIQDADFNYDINDVSSDVA